MRWIFPILLILVIVEAKAEVWQKITDSEGDTPCIKKDDKDIAAWKKKMGSLTLLYKCQDGTKPNTLKCKTNIGNVIKFSSFATEAECRGN